MKMRYGSIGCALAVLLAAGCGGKEDAGRSAQRPAPLVQVARAEQRDLTKFYTYTGSVEAVRAARMASPAEGPIEECLVREGDPVTPGQMLVRVGRSRIAETGLEAAREELRRQEAEFRRVEQLVGSGSLPGEQLDAARSDLRRAEAQVAAMETGTGDYKIKAPWAGLVSRVWIAEGDYVAPRALLIEMYDPTSLVVRISVPEQQSLAVRVGQTVQVRLDAYPGRRFPGKIARVYPELERTTRTLTVEAVLDETVRLLSGMFARVDVAVETLKDAVVVPQSALVTLPGGETVVFVLEGEKAARRDVRTAMESGGAVAVESGIQAGEMVIVRGNETLRDGAAVRVAGAGRKEGGRPGGEAAPVQQGAPETNGKTKPAS